MRNKRFNWVSIAFAVGITLGLSTPAYAQADIEGEPRVLAGVDLSGADLSGADLSGTLLVRVNLAEANLSGANLSGAVLRKVAMAGVNLDGTDLTETRFEGDKPLKGVSLVSLLKAGINLSAGVDLRGVDRSGVTPFQSQCTIRLSLNVLKDPDLKVDPLRACVDLTDEDIVQIFRKCFRFVYPDIMSEWRWIPNAGPRNPARSCILASLEQ